MRYALAFLLAAVCLTTGAVATFAHISSTSLAVAQPPSPQPTADTVPTAGVPTRIVLLSAELCLFASLVHGQRPRRDSRAVASQSTVGVRAELATVLLQSGRYDEAAREFRVLLARDPSNFDYRLGLARALAWGDHPREAERELTRLLASRPGTPGLDSLLRTVRDAYDPPTVDAAAWVTTDPWYSPYRP